jgi:PhzF family phenazine biosynthesis protein
MTSRPFTQVDVFCSSRGRGNPLAVVHDGSGLSDAELQAFAHWTNVSETTFLFAPTTDEADYKVRIFTPAEELPFAGHPTLGTCHAWLEAGGTPRDGNVIVQECGAGLVRVTREGERLAFGAPPRIKTGPVDAGAIEQIASWLGVARADIVDAQWVDNGPGWVAVVLPSVEAVLKVKPGVIEQKVGVVGKYDAGAPAAIELRAFFSVDGVTREDPVTGSLNASVAQWMLESGQLRAPYVASQGAALGRAGEVFVSQGDDGTVWIGGASTSLIKGTVEL